MTLSYRPLLLFSQKGFSSTFTRVLSFGPKPSSCSQTRQVSSLRRPAAEGRRYAPALHPRSLPAIATQASRWSIPFQSKDEYSGLNTPATSPLRSLDTIASYERRKVQTCLLLASHILMDQRREFSQESTSQGGVPPNKDLKLKLRRKRLQVPNYGPDADKAVRSLQNAHKERHRAKTAANVRRALIGNVAICAAKLGAWVSSGSSSMMSEFIHSVVDCGNQALLLMGLRDSKNAADPLHPYGYGKSVYFWALVSALGTFFLGAGISMSHSIGELANPSLQDITKEVWGVLAFSFAVDGYVWLRTIQEIREDQPNNVSFYDHVMTLRDPATLAVLLEDGAACLGIVIAIAGISASHVTGMPIFDGAAGVGISVLLGGMGLALVRVNHRFLLGQGVSKEMTDDIERIILSRRSIDNVYSIQSQWTGPETFSFKAEIDVDGTYLAAELMPRYQGEFEEARKDFDEELHVLLSWYAEDVIRAVEREVRHIEAMIRQKYPGAEYIELEPMSKDADRFAIDDSFEEKLLKIEREEMQRLIRVLHQSSEAKKPMEGEFISATTPNTSPIPEASRSPAEELK